MSKESKMQKKQLRILALLLMITMISGCSKSRKISEASEPDKNSNKVEYNPTLVDNGEVSIPDEDTIAESITDTESVDVSAEFEDKNTTVEDEVTESSSKHQHHSGELIPPKHSTSDTPPKNPTDEDIGVEGDDTWYIKVGNSVIPNFEKHIDEDVIFTVNDVKFKLSYSVDKLLSILKKNDWGIVGNTDRIIDTKFAPGEELVFTIGNEEGLTIMTVKAFNPYKNTYVKPADFQPYFYSITVSRLENFDFLNVKDNENLYDYQYIKNSEQFPMQLDEARIYCKVRTGLGYASFYDDGNDSIAGFVYELSAEGKEALMKEEYK